MNKIIFLLFAGLVVQAQAKESFVCEVMCYIYEKNSNANDEKHIYAEADSVTEAFATLFKKCEDVHKNSPNTESFALKRIGRNALLLSVDATIQNSCYSTDSLEKR